MTFDELDKLDKMERLAQSWRSFIVGVIVGVPCGMVIFAAIWSVHQ